ncbi:MAG: Glutamate 5-kinase [Alphaproteobacteria bacterium MarineAlpha11_Bin1]|nr:MAG: Glutamate 5-kinase [Alphaproteobacteria bacterium MarineAlpha11_Bin1]|tara:strand:- start:17940 stop:19097 length:1158 start_codon:yes stop_codon:yes gene_type:complete
MDTVGRSSEKRLALSRRLIIKIGSALLVDDSNGEIRTSWLAGLAGDIADQRARGTEIVVVSSGAIATGRNQLGLADGGLALEQKQAAAATGQIKLASAWQDALGMYDLTVAQILLTLSDTEQRRRHLNARATIETLIQMGAIPVINENDTVATEEIRYGDNDRLAARVAQMTSADTLVLLSDVNGLYDADPRLNGNATLIPEVTEITPRIEAMAGVAPAGYSSGGMVTKLEAAKIATAAGCAMVITNGNTSNALSALVSGCDCTWFLPNSEPLTARKRWIAGAITASGAFLIDTGAFNALKSGKSLLPAGIAGIEGQFERGDSVEIKVLGSGVIGRGLSAYSSDDAVRIAGRKSREIEGILGYRGRDEMIHRDDMVLELSALEAP